MKQTRGKPNNIDKHIGKRIKLRRSLMGMTQGALGDALGITFQQIQKYETAKSRVAASRLYEIAEALGVPFEYFVIGLKKSMKGWKS